MVGKKHPRKWFFICKTCGQKVKARLSKSLGRISLLSAIRKHYWTKHRDIISRKRKKYDPSKIEVIERKTSKNVLDYKDYSVRGLIRLLFLEDGTIFPEYAIYDARKAGLKKDFIYRGKEFNLFVYR